MPARRRQLGSLSIQRAFVVHLAARRAGRRRFMGRVEHLPSGRATTFFSLAELLRFLEQAPDEGFSGPGRTPRHSPE